MKRAFTLLEMAIALIILGIIGGLSIPLLRSLQEKKSSQDVQYELQTLKKRIIAYYQSYGRIPVHTVSYNLNRIELQVPVKYTVDPISGIPYMYVADTSASANIIYVDGNPLGEIAAVIISAGRNGKFDEENATAGDFVFQSQGGSGFDDILISISEMELRQGETGSPSMCPSYSLIVENRYGSSIYIRPITANSPTIVLNGQTVTISNLSPFNQILIYPTTGFSNTSYSYLIPAKFDRNNNCTIRITIYNQANVPVFTDDQN
ncbi:MAG: prepilin-type N-terminal cleavage/methylation domain-containing protein [Candidatus Hydrothermia bacterium]